MKSSSTLGLAVVLRALLAGLALYMPAAAGSAPGMLTLKALVQISANDVTLADVVASPTEAGFPGALVICHAPDQGTVRMVSVAEIAALLKKHDLKYTLQGAAQVSIVRTARRISAAELRPVVESALRSADPTAKVAEVELQASISVGSDPDIKLLKLRFDPAIQKYRVWFMATSESRKTTFQATVTLERGTVPIEINASSPSQSPSLLPVLVHRGETAMMELQGDGFTAKVPVVCLEDGKEATLVHVRDKASKRNYRAQVLARELLRVVSREN
jgi:hypothetical protein